MPPAHGRTLALTRLATGLVLFFYVLTHNLNHTLGLVSLDALEAGRSVFLGFWRFPLIEPLLGLSLLIHLIIGLRALYRRRSLRMPPLEALQLVLGLAAPPLLFTHVLGTTGAYHAFDTNDSYAFVLYAIWVVSPYFAFQQSAALLLTWFHGCIGLYFWLHLKPWFLNWSRVFSVLALLLPVLALTGFITGAKEVAHLASDPDWRADFLADANPPDASESAALYDWQARILIGYFLAIATVLVARLLRSALQRRRAIRVHYPDGKEVVIQPGTSLLEASRIGNIPHASICGGRSRCSTCRVRVIRGDEHLNAINEEEARVLTRVKAPPGVRLACQARPTGPVMIQPLMPPNIGTRQLFSASELDQGKELEVAILFADLRNFTGMAEKRLPYDVVFLLNQYFRIMGEAVRAAGGHLDKFIGDGVMAIFGLRGQPELACAQALDAAKRMSEGLQAFNRQHAAELSKPLQIGIGIHFGAAIVGEMGYGRATTLTAIGDTVNTASRLESATKELGCELLISAIAAKAAELDATLGKSCEVALRGRDERLPAIAIADAGVLGT